MSFEAILYIAVLILSAKIFGEALHRINQPTIIGNVLAGIIVGPALFFLVEPIDEIEIFVSIGVFFLFFLIGLEEIDLTALFKVLRGRIFAGSALGFLIPFVAAGVFGFLAMDMDFVKSLAIASVIGASSLGVTAKVLTDMGKLRSKIGLEIFTMAGIIEFIAIIFTSVVIQVDSSLNPEIEDFAWLFAKMILFFAVAGLLSVFALPHFFRFIRKHLQAQQVYFAVVIGVILLVAYFAEISGIHGAIGALLLGIAVSRMNKKEYTEISKSVHVIGYGIFIPIFFAGIGLHFTLSFFELPLWVIGGFLAIIVGAKFIGSYLAAKVAHMKPARTVAYGIMSKGAVDLALMLSLLNAELLENNLFSLLVFGTLITMIISSVELQRTLKKIVPVKIGSQELALVPVYFRRAVSEYAAENAMVLDYPTLSPDISVDDALKNNDNEFFVVLDENNLVGLVSKRDLERAQKKLRRKTAVKNVMHKKFRTAIPQEPLFFAIQKLNSNPASIVPVMEPLDSKLVGVVTAEKILELLENNESPKQ
ncbi:germination protein gerN [Candidatus Nitrosopumilus koreensis AR1]|uniref:Germination protein gerN n=1 Tax=Candidatus Nitrosopumilus koreensis AR1 TaxID=1229908 RepID=K0B9D2_9ARCH|nr:MULTISPECIES: cation:proton antiporter [Nitrosopumilus]AFS81061.1 germination protein gerN [Candidatus Nitrosopumilus koreensis AR1]